MTLVLIHGFKASYVMLFPILNKLSHHYWLVSHDLLAHDITRLEKLPDSVNNADTAN
jgi:hypothetical protein